MGKDKGSRGAGRARKEAASVATGKSAKERVEEMRSERLGVGSKCCRVYQVTLRILAFTRSDSAGYWELKREGK